MFIRMHMMYQNKFYIVNNENERLYLITRCRYKDGRTQKYVYDGPKIRIAQSKTITHFGPVGKLKEKKLNITKAYSPHVFLCISVGLAVDISVDISVNFTS